MDRKGSGVYIIPLGAFGHLMFGHVSYQRIAGCPSVWNFKIYVVYVLQSPFRNEANTVIILIASFYYKSQEKVANFPRLLRRELGYFRFMHSSFMDLSWNLSWVISKRWWWSDRYLTFWVFPSNIFNSFRWQNHSTFLYYLFWCDFVKIQFWHPYTLQIKTMM